MNTKTVWSYMSIENFSHAGLTGQINTLAKEGWELVCVVHTGSRFVAFLKRAK